MMRIGSKTRCMLIALSTVTTFGWAPAYAGVALQDYAHIKNSEGFKHYLNGVEAGFQQANAELQLRRVKKLYCAPANSRQRYENYIEILEKEVKDNGTFYTVDTPVESALLFGLMKTFPCR